MDKMEQFDIFLKNCHYKRKNYFILKSIYSQLEFDYSFGKNTFSIFNIVFDKENYESLSNDGKYVFNKLLSFGFSIEFVLDVYSNRYYIFIC